MPDTAPNIDAIGDAVWDRIWREAPSDARDQALLDREAASDRWRLLSDRVIAQHGTFEGLRTIELGAGRGDLSVLLARQGADVTLLDRNDAALAAARDRFDRLGLNARFVKGDLLDNLHEQLVRPCFPQTMDRPSVGQTADRSPVPQSMDRASVPQPVDRASVPGPACFDLSLSAGVIEHFKGPHRTAALRAHHDVLAPGGMSAVSVPHALCPPYRLWKAYLELRGWWPYGMEIPYHRREMRRRANACGFAPVELHTLHLKQSLGNHWVKRMTGRSPRWTNEPSALDRWFGSMLLMFGWRGGTTFPLPPGGGQGEGRAED